MTKQALPIGVAVILALFAGGMQAATAKTKETLSETDLYALDMAKNACQNPMINVVRNGDVVGVPGESYGDFPIGMMDNNWITRASMLAWETNPDAEFDHVKIELNQSQSNQWAVDWQVVRYGGAELDEVIERIGDPGVLSFEPFNGCWRLIEDYRGQG